MVCYIVLRKWDQTRLSYVPVSEWTMEKEGAKLVKIDDKDDKR